MEVKSSNKLAGKLLKKFSNMELRMHLVNLRDEKLFMYKTDLLLCSSKTLAYFVL